MEVPVNRRIVVDRVVDVATVILISLAALGTAWCGYQSARWDALQALNFSRSNAARIQASTYSNRTNAHRAVDVLLFTEWVAASDRDPAFATFLRARFDPALEQGVRAWLATDPRHNPRAPRTPFQMSAYRLVEEAQAADANRRADAFVEEAVHANEVADEYLFQTVLFAASSFLGGIALKLRPPAHLVATIIGFALFFFALISVIRYPIR